jgi:hypothetical protein
MSTPERFNMIRSLLRWVSGLLPWIGSKPKDHPYEGRSEEIKKIERGIRSYISGHSDHHDYYGFSEACLEAFMAILVEHENKGGTIERNRMISFTGNLVSAGIFEGSYDGVIGTIQSAIKRTHDGVIIDGIGKYRHQAEILSRNLRQIILYLDYIDDATINRACQISGLFNFIEV